MSDVTLSEKLGLHIRDHGLTYRVSACVEFGLIIRRRGKRSELTPLGLSLVNSENLTEKEIETQKILSFLNSGGVKIMLKRFLVNNEGRIYGHKKFYTFLGC